MQALTLLPLTLQECVPIRTIERVHIDHDEMPIATMQPCGGHDMDLIPIRNRNQANSLHRNA